MPPHKNNVETNHMWPLFSDTLLGLRQWSRSLGTSKKPDMFYPHGAYSLVNKPVANYHMGSGKKSCDKRTLSTIEHTEGALALSIPAKIWE